MSASPTETSSTDATQPVGKQGEVAAVAVEGVLRDRPSRSHRASLNSSSRFLLTWLDGANAGLGFQGGSSAAVELEFGCCRATFVGQQPAFDVQQKACGVVGKTAQALVELVLAATMRWQGTTTG